MKKILISSFDMEVGGVERSLISMLNNFDYSNYEVDLMLYSHTGDFLKLLPKKPNLISENQKYKTIRMGIGEILKKGYLGIGISRVISKILADYFGKKNKIEESGYYQLQWMCKLTSYFLPKQEKEYDVAISYLWPHYFTLNRVSAKKKIGWIHTDYSTVETDIEMDLKMWRELDYIVAVSKECANSFLSKYPSLKNKMKIIENITSPEFIKTMAEEKMENFDKDSFNLLSVARFSHAKGIDNAVKALKILKDRGYKDIKWYVVGYGGDEGKIRELIRENNLENDFILLGKKINPYPYMKNCNLYVQPSRYEGKAVTVSEAQILGKTVMITSYATAMSQVKDREDGYICELSVEGIASGIEELYNQRKLREILEEKCREKDFSNVKELKKLYELF